MPAFEKFPIPQYQSNDVENCLVISPICQVRFSNLPGFNRSFLPVRIGDFLQIAPFENLQKQEKQHAKFPFVLHPGNDDSRLFLGILSSWENGIPLNRLFTLGGRLFNQPKPKHVLKRAESHRCEVIKLLFVILARFLRFLKGTHFRKLPTESERNDQS